MKYLKIGCLIFFVAPIFAIIVGVVQNKDSLKVEQKVDMVQLTDEFIRSHKALDFSEKSQDIMQDFLNNEMKIEGDFFASESDTYPNEYIVSMDYEFKKGDVKDYAKKGYQFTYFLHRIAGHYKLPLVSTSYNAFSFETTPNKHASVVLAVNVAKKLPEGALSNKPLSYDEFKKFMYDNINYAVTPEGKTLYKDRCQFRES